VPLQLEVGVDLGPEQLEELFGRVDVDEEEASPRVALKIPASRTLPDCIILCRCGPTASLTRLSSSKTTISWVLALMWNSISESSFLPLRVDAGSPFPPLLMMAPSETRRELRRFHLLRSWVNKGKRKDQDC